MDLNKKADCCCCHSVMICLLLTYTKEENAKTSSRVDGQHQLIAVNTILNLPHELGEKGKRETEKVQKRRGSCKGILYIYKLSHENGEMRKKQVKKSLTISSIQGQGKHYTQKVTPNITTPTVRVYIGCMLPLYPIHTYAIISSC